MAAKRTPKRGARLSRTKSSRKKSVRSNPTRQKSRANRPEKNFSCPIVGIGGSAGGFEAAMELLRLAAKLKIGREGVIEKSRHRLGEPGANQSVRT